MALTGQEKFHFKINKGLYTEGGYLDSPIESWRDGENVVPNLNGSVQRRKGIDYELDYTWTTSMTDSDKENLAVVVEHWNSVSGDGSRNFIVVQKGTLIEFYDNVGDGVGGTRRPFTIDLTSYQPGTNPNSPGNAPISCVSGNGKLVIVSSDTEPLLVEFDENTNTITTSQLDVKIRDFDGLVSTESGTPIAVDYNPATLDASHNYNLLNQGWLSAHITTYHTANSVYPDNSQQWVVGKDSSDVFQAALLDKHDFGTSPAPKGRFILDVFSRNYSGVSGVGGLATATEAYRPSTAAFFAGRIWYAGINSDDLSTWVMFSRVARTSTEFGQCHQVNDPTAEIIADLIDSDGGVIPIQDAGTIVKLMPLGNSMVVFCDNGVWQIVSGENGFTASSYSVHKISSIGCVSAQSVVLVEDTVMFCGTGGIYALTFSDNASAVSSGTFSVKSVSDNTIKTKYETIVPSARQFIRAIYNEEDQVVHFLYNDSTSHSDTVNRFQRNALLTFDARIGAWYSQKFYNLDNDEVDAYTGENVAVKTPYVYDMWLSKGRSSTTADFQVIESDLDTVTDSGGDFVVIRASIDSSRDRTVKFLASGFHRHDGRATYGTRYDSAGLIEEIAFLRERHYYNPTSLAYVGVHSEANKTNEALSSEDFDSSDWTKTRTTITRNSTASPDGTTTADTLVEDGTASNTHLASQAYTFTAATHTFSVYAKESTRSELKLEIDDGTTVHSAWFDLSGGTVGTLANATAAIETCPSGWYRCSVTTDAATAAAAGNVRIKLGSGSETESYNGDSVSGVFLWGAMLEASSAARTYIPTRNLLLRSEEMDNATWSKTDITIGADSASVLAPNEQATADLLTEGSAGTAVISQPFTLPTADTTFSASFFIKRSATVTWIKVAAYETAASTNTVEGWVRIDDGNEAAGSVNNGGTATGAAISITAVQDRDGLVHNDWFRVVLSGAVNNSATALTFAIHSANADAVATRLSSSAYFVWGAQVETRTAAQVAGYWPTVGDRSVTRVADAQRDYWRFAAADWHNARDDVSKWKDWYSADVNDAAGKGWVPFIETGYEVQTSGGIRRLQAPAIYVFTSRTELGLSDLGDALSANSVFLQTKWDWSDGARANKWGVAEQCYKPRIGYVGGGPYTGTLTDLPVVQSKTRVRGAGKALQMKFSGEEDKDFNLLGWAVAYQTHTPTG